ncbi:MAG: TetR/AcrR family transcriptional regulator [Myxococcales bacterium]|nr:TetR/AcrR family transcriptional regulator [Myxococcales bacterium]
MPKIVDHEAYRLQLVEGSADLFSQHGFAGVTMRGVARALNVSTGTLYHYFESKETLFEATVAHVVSRNASVAIEVLQPQVASGLRLGVRDVLDFLILQEEQQIAQFVVLMDYWRLHPEGRDALRPAIRQAHYAYADIVAGLLGSRDQGLGELVLSVLFNIIEMRWLHGSSFPAEPQIKLLERLVDDCLQRDS